MNEYNGKTLLGSTRFISSEKKKIPLKTISLGIRQFVIIWRMMMIMMISTVNIFISYILRPIRQNLIYFMSVLFYCRHIPIVILFLSLCMAHVFNVKIMFLSSVFTSTSTKHYDSYVLFKSRK